MFDTPSLFDAMELDNTQQRVASRRALALAHTRVDHYLGAFLRGAKSAEEFDARLALVQEDFDGYVSTASAEVGHPHPEHIAASLKDHYKVGFGEPERRVMQPGYPDAQGGGAVTEGDAFDQGFGGGQTCAQCGNPMNPVDAMINPVCLNCAKGNHQQVANPTPYTAADHVEFEPTDEDEEEEVEEGKKSSVATGGWRHATPLADSAYGDYLDRPGYDESYYNERPETACPNCGSPNSHQGFDGQTECIDCGYAPEGSYPPGRHAADANALVTCPECGGDGKTAGAARCGKCRGAGKVPNFGDSMLDHVAANPFLGPDPYDVPGDNFVNQYGEQDLDPMRNPQGYIRPSVPHPIPSATVDEGYERIPQGVDPSLAPGQVGPRDYGQDAGLQVGPTLPPVHPGPNSRIPVRQGADGNTGLGGPEPKMDKGQWDRSHPGEPKVDDGKWPTKRKDVVEPIKATNDSPLSEIGDIEKVKLPANSGDAGFDGGKQDFGPHTDTFGGEGQADPVTGESLEDKQSKADDAYSNPLVKLMSGDDFPSDATVQAAFRKLR